MDQRDRMRARCVEMGLAWAKANVSTFMANENGPYVAEWINEQEAAAAAALENKQLELASRSTKAAEASASAADASAKTSGTSARAAMFSAFVSLLALVVAVAAYFKQR